MYRRLSLALLLLSASLCGMEGERKKQGVLAALKAKFFGRTPLPDLSEAAAEGQEEGLSHDRPDVTIEQLGAEPSATGPSHMCMGSEGPFFPRAKPPQRCFFPGEQGEGNYY